METIKTSEVFVDLAKALSQAQGEFTNAVMNSKNPHFNSDYADMESVRSATIEALTKYNLLIMQHPVTLNDALHLTTILMHSSGQWIESTFKLNVEKPTMQGLKSAMTYARRTAWLSILGVAEADDDGNEAEKHPSLQKPKTAPKVDAPIIEWKMSQAQRSMLWARMSSLGKKEDEAKTFMQSITGKESSSLWVKADFDKVLKAMDDMEKVTK
jgi:hypothetical protein